MNTDDLVSMLATHTPPVRQGATYRQLGLALSASLPVAFFLMALVFGVRHDLMQVLGVPMLWVKLSLGAVIGCAGFVTLGRLARPGVPIHLSWLGMVLPVACLWVYALITWVQASPADRPELLWGQTWKVCVFSISLIALPVFAATLKALRDLAPTRPALAGAVAGALAGGSGAAVYALHCPEFGAPFLAVWYVSGMAVPVLAGAFLGPRLLRW